MDDTAADAARRLLGALPELRAYEGVTVRLNPRPGAPGSGESHVGGPLLWPAGEAWPRCGAHKGEGGYAMVAVAQLRAADVPRLPFPGGADVVQILWCPVYHDQPHEYGWGPACRVVWRRGADVADVLRDQSDGLTAWQDDPEGIVPRPCVLHPEVLPEYPAAEELPPELGERLAAEGMEGAYDYVSALAGCKAGGSMEWAAAERPDPLACPVCAAPYTLLLQVDSYEYLPNDLVAYGPSRWSRPAESALVPGSEAHRRACRPTGMSVGRGDGRGGVFVCAADPAGHPATFFGA